MSQSIQQLSWPELDFSEWKETCETLHRWTQIIGKLKLKLCTPDSHWWHVTFSVTTFGLTSGPIPYDTLTFQVDFDLIQHELRILTSMGAMATVPLKAQSVRSFYLEFMEALGRLNIRVTFDTTPKEVSNPIPFEEDEVHCSYKREQVESFRMILSQCDRIFREFQSRFCGKRSNVQFFWGSFDLAITRFSGRYARIPNSSGIIVSTEEEFAFGFWPGNERYPKAAFYAYSLPSVEGFYESRIEPSAAKFDTSLGEFLLDYDDVRKSENPQAMILAFAQSTYVSLAELAQWDRLTLEQIVLEPIP